jgi:hypothetical protein
MLYNIDTKLFETPATKKKVSFNFIYSKFNLGLQFIGIKMGVATFNEPLIIMAIGRTTFSRTTPTVMPLS